MLSRNSRYGLGIAAATALGTLAVWESLSYGESLGIQEVASDAGLDEQGAVGQIQIERDSINSYIFTAVRPRLIPDLPRELNPDNFWISYEIDEDGNIPPEFSPIEMLRDCLTDFEDVSCKTKGPTQMYCVNQREGGTPLRIFDSSGFKEMISPIEGTGSEEQKAEVRKRMKRGIFFMDHEFTVDLGKDSVSYPFSARKPESLEFAGQQACMEAYEGLRTPQTKESLCEEPGTRRCESKIKILARELDMILGFEG